MAHPDCDRVLDQAVHAAVEHLEKQGGFHPFAMTLKPDGEMAILHAAGDDDAPPPPEEADDVLAAGVTAASQDGPGLSAAALVADVQATLPDADAPSDAIRVLVQRPGEDPVAVFAPYVLTDGHCEVGDLIASPGNRTIFA